MKTIRLDVTNLSENRLAALIGYLTMKYTVSVAQHDSDPDDMDDYSAKFLYIQVEEKELTLEKNIVQVLLQSGADLKDDVVSAIAECRVPVRHAAFNSLVITISNADLFDESITEILDI